MTSAGHFVFKSKAGQPINHLALTPGVLDTIRLYNTGQTEITGLSISDGKRPIGTTRTGGSCIGKDRLAANQFCTITYQVSNKPNAGQFALIATGNNVDNSSEALTAHVASAGHFVFKDSLSKKVDDLKLLPGAAGTVILYNTGGMEITNFTLDKGSFPSGVTLNGTCVGRNHLAAGSHCTITYRVSHTPDAGQFVMTAAGNHADTPSQALSVKVASAGRFVFKNDAADQILSQLDLVPDTSTMIRLYNLGQTEIPGFSLRHGQLPTGTSLKGTCLTENSLPANSYCTMIYTVTRTPKSGQFSVTAFGRDVDNAPHVLSIKVASSGHFVFKNNAGDKALDKLALAPGRSDTIRLYNTGDTEVTGLAITEGTLPVGTTRTGGTCVGKSRLLVGEYCTLTYQVVNKPDAGQFTITATGNNVDNSSEALTAHVASAGHFVFKDSLSKKVDDLKLLPGAAGTVILYNTGGMEITNFTLDKGSFPSGVTLNGTCVGRNHLAAGSHCTITYQVSHTPDAGQFVMTAAGNHADIPLQALAVKVVSAGHFVFTNDAADKTLNKLDLAPGDAATIRLYNMGQTDITDFSLCKGQRPAGVTLSGSCLGKHQLDAGENCTITYDVAGTSSAGQFAITATGNHVNNSSHTLAVSVASAGHYTFKTSPDTEVRQLDLVPGASGTLTLYNTGGTDITHFSLSPGSHSGVTFNGTCIGKDRLDSGSYCTIVYRVSSTPKSGRISFILRGTGVDRSFVLFDINVASAGHFVFKDGAGKEIKSVYLAAGSSGKLTVKNTGETAINRMKLMLPLTISRYFSGSCKTVASLQPNTSCDLDYTIPDAPEDQVYRIAVSGDNADNSPAGFTSRFYPIFAFITSDSGVKRCEVDPVTGNFSSCGDTSLTGESKGIAWNAKTSGLFVLKGSDKLAHCVVNRSSGVLSQCNEDSKGVNSNASRLVVNAVNTYVFIGSRSVGKALEGCSVNKSGDALSRCMELGTDINANYGIGIDPSGKFVFGDSDTNIRQLRRCRINYSRGDLVDCTNMTAPP